MPSYTQIIVSFLIGGLAIAFQTLIAERVSKKWRGVILTLPSTSALGLFFIGFTKSAFDVPEAAKFLIGALAPDYIFVAIFIFLSRINLKISLFGAFGAWAISAYLLLLYPPVNFASSVFFYCIPITIISYLLIRKLKAHHSPRDLGRNNNRFGGHPFENLWKQFWRFVLRISRLIHLNFCNLLLSPRQKRHPRGRQNSFHARNPRLYSLRIRIIANISFFRNLAGTFNLILSSPYFHLRLDGNSCKT